ncbi:MAG: 2,3,4,5-tetrahydropyridine-2,6-dicarboxylate N-succinyltransferase [Rectinemataceae bacterium]|nr:2,3,4,5-tetrahydropyridine-2,6-dicarboxylate N-succinyltransferase [Rectinemataceae bacterium]
MSLHIEDLEALFASQGSFDADAWEVFLQGLESGRLSATTLGEGGQWEAVAWVKKAILSGFKAGGLEAWDWPGGAFDRPAFPPRRFLAADGVRVVPGGSSARRGAHIAAGVVIMPPSYINVGAGIGAGTMVDSHVLVGSCARVGEKVHLSAGVQVGGVLEPPQARPVVIEDGAFIGGLCGIFEGIVIRKNAVLAPGIILSKSTRIFDLVKGKEWMGEVPESAVVVPGARPARGDYAAAQGISLQAPVIVKYRDAGTEASVALEAALR